MTSISIDQEKTDQIEIVHGSDVLTMKKEGSDWKTTDGKKLQADKISGMFSTIEFDKVKGIIDAPGTLVAYGLDKPTLEVRFKENGKELMRLSFGSDSKDPEGISIKTSDSPAVKVVSKDVYDRFNVKVTDLVDSTVSPAPKQ
jgi:Domain of unknown function (DUF4340)